VRDARGQFRDHECGARPRATLVGTVRAFTPVVQALVERRLTEMCTAVALGFGATATVNYEHLYPATVNTLAEARFAAEDFSFMLQVKPGAYLRIGQDE
jgi:metal-dependent amidase/aminoacylase/carboxypeptidase family protein